MSRIFLDILSYVTPLSSNPVSTSPMGFSFFCFLSFGVQSSGPLSAVLGNFYSVPETLYENSLAQDDFLFFKKGFTFASCRQSD